MIPLFSTEFHTWYILFCYDQWIWDDLMISKLLLHKEKEL